MGLAVYEAVQCRSYVVHDSPHGYLALMLNGTVSFSSRSVSLFAYILVGRPKDAFPVIRGSSLHGDPLWLASFG